MTTSSDFTGRTADLLIFQGVIPAGDVKVTAGWGTSGSLCTGVQKIAQSWMVLFLTEPGSILNEPARGSSFLAAMRSGRIQVDEDIPAEFALAAAQVKRTMTADASEAGTLEDDEILDSSTLLDYSINRELGWLYLKVRLLSKAGDDRTIYLPISVSLH